MTTHEEWAHLYRDQGWTLHRIALCYGITEKTVKRALLQEGVPIRPRGQKGSLVGAELAGTYKAVSQATGIPVSTLYYRRKRMEKKPKTILTSTVQEPLEPFTKEDLERAIEALKAAADYSPGPDGDACNSSS